MRAALKAAIILGLCLIFLTVSLLLIPVYLLLPKKRLQISTYLVHWFSRHATELLGVEVKNRPPAVGNTSPARTEAPKRVKGRLRVYNHLGYLDVLALAAQGPVCFVTSVEVREMPFLGWLAQAGGCLFVERRSRSSLQSEVSEITHALLEGHHVCIFPEATSTNGEMVLRFRSPLFQAAIDAGAVIEAASLEYTLVDQRPLTPETRDWVCWYGDMGFLSSLTGLATARHVELKIGHALSLAPPHTFGAKEIAALTHREVSSRFRPLVPSSRAL